MPGWARPIGRAALFQSAPAIAGGRCASRTDRACPSASFQSAPAIAGGRCVAHGAQVAFQLGFNPRPPLLAGDALRRNIMTYQAIVSIRARHCWRAMPCRMRHTPPLSAVSIRARHCWRAMPCACWCAWQALRFQSAPAIAGGRCQAEPCEGPRGGSFNPRPPLLAGDAPCPFLNTARWKVSIRARHCWRAMPRILRAARYALPVSIRARHC